MTTAIVLVVLASLAAVNGADDVSKGVASLITMAGYLSASRLL